MAKPLTSLLALRAAITGTSLTAASSALAAPALMMNVMVNPIASVADLDIGCVASEREAKVLNLAVPPAQIVDKSSTILGGEMSALDLIKMRQSGGATATISMNTAVATPVRKLEPAAAGIRTVATNCGTPALTMSASPRIKPFESAPTNDFLASKRVSIGRTTFDADWRRVARENLSGLARRSIDGTHSASLDTIEKVNRWVNHEIRYVEDRDLFGQADYWAGAKVTLAMRKGDCEDIALTKMQMLADAGFDRGDMFLTIARDRVRNIDHALLIVKLAGRFVILDNSTDQLLDGAYSHDYAPVLSFSEDKKWVHGI